MSGLPIRRAQFDVQGFLAYVAEHGGEVGKPTNPYEVVRYRAYWRFTTQASVHVVYAKENGLLTFTGGSKGHYRAFLAGHPMTEHPSETTPPAADAVPRPIPAIAKPSKSKSKKPTREKLLARDGDGCWFCGEPMGDDCTLEHLIARARGGTNTLDNYALAHQRCNLAAADKPLVEKLAMRAQLRKAPA